MQTDDAPVGGTLILLRHAKSGWPEGVDDIDRPLAERGVDDATAAGPVLVDIARPDVVLCSPARRTRETWGLVSLALSEPLPPQIEPVVYGASAEEIIELLRTVPPAAATVVLVGHEPTMSQTATALAGPGSAADDLSQVRDKYPTCAMAVFEVPGSWAQLAPAGARLRRFLVPRG